MVDGNQTFNPLNHNDLGNPHPQYVHKYDCTKVIAMSSSDGWCKIGEINIDRSFYTIITTSNATKYSMDFIIKGITSYSQTKASPIKCSLSIAANIGGEFRMHVKTDKTDISYPFIALRKDYFTSNGSCRVSILIHRYSSFSADVYIQPLNFINDTAGSVGNNTNYNNMYLPINENLFEFKNFNEKNISLPSDCVTNLSTLKTPNQLSADITNRRFNATDDHYNTFTAPIIEISKIILNNANAFAILSFRIILNSPVTVMDYIFVITGTGSSVTTAFKEIANGGTRSFQFYLATSTTSSGFDCTLYMDAPSFFSIVDFQFIIATGNSFAVPLPTNAIEKSSVTVVQVS